MAQSADIQMHGPEGEENSEKKELSLEVSLGRGGEGGGVVRTNVRRTCCFRAQCAPHIKPRAPHAYNGTFAGPFITGPCVE